MPACPDYTAKLQEQGKHGGAWIYDVDSNEQLEQLLAMSPVCRFSNYEVLPLAEMESPSEILPRAD